MINIELYLRNIEIQVKITAKPISTCGMDFVYVQRISTYFLG